MTPEIEAKFLGIDHDDIRAKLQQLGAVCTHPMRLMRRAIIETPHMEGNHGHIRVRDEGDKVTLTYKQFDARSVDGTQEIEVTVSSFDDTIALLATADLTHKSIQESKRETWQLGDTEIVLDLWPWLNPYIEIEGLHEDKLRSVAEQLGLSWNDAKFGSVMTAYSAQYSHLTPTDTVATIPQVRFDDPLPAMLQS